MTGPNVPNPQNFNFPPPGSGGMPPQPPQYNVPPPHYYQQPGPPQYGNVPPQYQQHPHQQYPQQPNQYGNQAPPVHAYLAGHVQYPAGFDPHLVPVWDPNSPDGTTRPVQSKVSARPPRVGYNAIGNWEAGDFIHEDRDRRGQKRRQDIYKQRGSELVFDALPRLGRFLGRIAFEGTTTSPERVRAGYRRKEVGRVVSELARVGLAALHLTGLTAVSYGPRTGTRFYSNYVTLKRTAKDSLRTVVAKQGEAPHQLRGQVPAQSFYANNPFPHLGGNTAPTSRGQARRDKQQAARDQRAQQLQAQQQGGQPQAKPNRAQQKAQKARQKAAKARQKAVQRYQKKQQGGP